MTISQGIPIEITDILLQEICKNLSFNADSINTQLNSLISKGIIAKLYYRSTREQTAIRSYFPPHIFPILIVQRQSLCTGNI